MLKKWMVLLFTVVLTLSVTSPIVTYGQVGESEYPEVPIVVKQEISLGVAATGQMNATHTYDWYKVTIPSDGYLELGLKGPLKTKGYIKLYDRNAVKEIEGKYVESVTEGKIGKHLIAGTYYVKIERADNDWSYTLNNSFTASTRNDSEPNDIAKNASILKSTDNKAGHLGYYSKDYVDNVDYWSIDVQEEGTQKIIVNTFNDLRGTIRLYNPNAATEIASKNIGYEAVTTATIEKYLAPGKYYVVFTRDGGYSPGEYTIDTAFTKFNVTNDVEPNNLFEEAKQINIGTTYTGNLGAYEKNTTDTLDWYKFDLSQDGQVTFNIQGNGDVKGRIAVFKSDGADVQKDFVLGNEGIIAGNVAIDLKAGSYYFRVETYDAKVWSYSFSSSFIEKVVEEDRPWESAQTMALNGSVSARIDGFNTEDWWKVTTNENGTLEVKITTNGSSPGSYVSLYDIESLREIQYAWIDSGSTSYDITSSTLRPGTYYIKVLRWYGDREYNYTLSNTLTPAMYEADKEPNSSYQTAQMLDINTTTTGHLGYYSRKTTDDFDWYKVDMPADGTFTITLETSMAKGNAPGSYMALYDQDNMANDIAYLWMDSGKEYTIVRELAKGTYYIKLQRWYGDRIYSYKLTTNIEQSILTNDETPDNNNDMMQNAKVLALGGSTTGHLGYYVNGYTDNADWYTVTTTQDGELTVQFDFNMEQGTAPGSYMTLYDVDGTANFNVGWILLDHIRFLKK